jgi:tetratricopeptide (TPR) repeat protein
MKIINDIKKDALLFLEAGFIALNQAEYKAAEDLFNTAEVLDADRDLCDIGRGYLALHKMKIHKAREWFEKVHKRSPDNQMAATFLAWANIMDEKYHSEGEAACEKILKEAKDPGIKKFADSALEFSKNYSGPSSSPFNLHKKTQRKHK